ncbi:26s proteasome non-ATPase regulatory subunit [Cyclospora cayetanensis]|uniref:26s proteasome non-ATPase regulatory subunit n=1 Tax=Cyclospora cayetanensis TaxID=88456 RepID=A0A1D3CRQ9_9EIME|nr:26s proteasome non-ATPase regulatory subunit [Cyclospora cayetanensis]
MVLLVFALFTRPGAVANCEQTEDDKKIRDNIDLLVERTCDSDLGIVALALETLSRELKAATSSMTSVPKPLKFLRPHVDGLVDRYKELPAGTDLKRDFAMVLSVICTTCGDARRLSLHFCLEAECKDVTSWGYEFLRNLSGQIASAFAELQQQDASPAAQQQEEVAADGARGKEAPAVEEDRDAVAPQTSNRDAKALETPKPTAGLASIEVTLPTTEQLLQLVEEIVPYYMQHNAEVDAIDLLTEVERPQSLLSLLDANNYQRVVAYLLSLSNYAASAEESLKVQMVAFDALMQQQQHFDAMRVALRLGDRGLVDKVLADCKDPLMRQQLALLLCRQRVDVEFEDEKLQRLASGSKTSPFFRILAKELDVLEPKEPEDVFKRHLEDPHGRRARLAGLESAQQNLASSFVNAFVNCGFGTDKLMTADGNSWLYKNKDRGLLSTTASLGALSLWNVDEALQHLDKHQYSNDANVKAGALLDADVLRELHLRLHSASSAWYPGVMRFSGFGVSSCNVRHECDAALALLKDQLEATEMTADTPLFKAAAAIGLGCAYAGSCREDVLELLTLVILDGSLPLECSSFASLSLGLCFVGSASADAAEAILTALMDRCSAASEAWGHLAAFSRAVCVLSYNAGEAVKIPFGKAMDSPLGHFLSVGLGLVFLGTRDAAEGVLCAVAALPHAAFSAAATRIIEGLACAGSGDVLKVQRMLGVCAESRPEGYWKQKQKELNSEQQEEEAAVEDGPSSGSATASTRNRGVAGSSSSGSSSGATNTASTMTLDDDDDHVEDIDQAAAVLNIALIAFAEETGAEMALRLYVRRTHALCSSESRRSRATCSPLALPKRRVVGLPQ